MAELEDILYRVQCPYFTAGLVLRMGLVYDAAPILRYMLGWPLAQAEEYVRRRGWSIDIVEKRQRPP